MNKKTLRFLIVATTLYVCAILWITSDITLTAEHKAEICFGYIIILWLTSFFQQFIYNDEDDVPDAK